jgi:type I restriction enzyme S subunit
MKFELTSLGVQSVFFNNLRKPVTRSARTTGRYPYYGAAGIQDLVSDYLFDGSYILVGEDGTVVTNGEYPVVQIAEGKFWVNNHAHVLRPLDSCDFYYLLKGTKVTNLITGAVQPKLSMTNLKSLELIWPENPKVRLAIGQVLRLLDRKIQINKELSKTLEDIAQTIFKSWFIDFDPVKAKMAGEKPVGMDDATAALFPDSMEDSELGLIPRGWGIKNLSALSDISKITVNPQKHLHTIFTQYSIPAFDSGGYPVEGTGSSILSNKFVLGGSAILVSKLNPRTTRVWTVLEPPASGICSTEFIVLMPRSDTLLPFINSIVRDSKFLEALASMATGSTGSRQRVRPEDIFQIGVFVPSGDLIAKLFEVQFPMLQHIQNLKDENQSLSKLRDSLLPRLISGELQISEEMLVT